MTRLHTVLRHPAALAALLLCLTGCTVEPALGPNPFTGCYDNSCVGAPVRVGGVPALVTLSTSNLHTCGLTSAGEAWCWGSNFAGELGDGSAQTRNAPVRVDTDVRFSRISAGGMHTCALALDGAAYCWGAGGTGLLGTTPPESCGTGPGTEPCATRPVRLEGTWTDLSAGRRHACALDPSGAAHCWGLNMLGETGTSNFEQAVTRPTRVLGTSVFRSVHAGEMYTCGLTAQGQALCWGSAARGELGRPAPVCTTIGPFQNPCSPTPGPVQTAARFTMLSVGNSHACGVTTGDAVVCWGDNGQGQLGSGDFGPGTPGIAQGGMTFTAISASSAVTCGTRMDGGTSVCWGLNLMGKLGIGSRLELSLEPLPIEGDPGFTAFAGGTYHVCALTASGETWCWGEGRLGQLGDGPRLP